MPLTRTPALSSSKSAICNKPLFQPSADVALLHVAKVDRCQEIPREFIFHPFCHDLDTQIMRESHFLEKITDSINVLSYIDE